MLSCSTWLVFPTSVHCLYFDEALMTQQCGKTKTMWSCYRHAPYYEQGAILVQLVMLLASVTALVFIHWLSLYRRRAIFLKLKRMLVPIFCMQSGFRGSNGLRNIHISSVGTLRWHLGHVLPAVKVLRTPVIHCLSIFGECRQLTLTYKKWTFTSHFVFFLVLYFIISFSCIFHFRKCFFCFYIITIHNDFSSSSTYHVAVWRSKI